MRTTAFAWAACAWMVAAATAERPPHWVAEMHRGWAFELNAGRYGAAAATLTADGVVLPEGGVDIVGKDGMQAYFAGRPARRRILWPQASLKAGQGAVMHTAGTNLLENTTYYIRMVHAVTAETEGWEFDTVVLSSSKVTPIETEASVPEWLATKLHSLRVQLEEGAFDETVDTHFTADAVLVDDMEAGAGPVLVPREGIAGVLRKLIPSPTFARPHLFRVVAVAETAGGAVHHLLAEQTSTLTGRVHRCYMRWAGWHADARVEVLMASVGEGCEGPKCHGVTAAPSAAAVPAWLADAERAYSTAYSTGDVTEAAGQHAANGVIVPHTATRLVRAGPDAESYLKALRVASPAMDLRARAVLKRPVRHLLGSEVVLHVVGVNRANGGEYYMRWTAHHDYAPGWRVGTAVFGSGNGVAIASTGLGEEMLAPAGGRNAQPPAWMAARIATMTALYNKGATQEFAKEMFSDDAVLVSGAAASELVEGGAAIASAIDQMRAHWASTLTLRVVDAVNERDGIWSMIGEAAPRTGAGTADARRFYVRWVYAGARDAWVAEVVVARVGAAAAWPVRARDQDQGAGGY